MIRLLNDKTISGIRFGKGTIVTLLPSAEAELIASGEATTAFAVNNSSNIITGIESQGSILASPVHPYYHFHGFAGNQIAGDSKFFDLSGGNHGVRGANLSDAQMFASPGYVSTLDPIAGATDSTIHIPAINFDYDRGEKLIIWWFGSASPEAADVPFLGDGYGTAEGQHGFRVRIKTNGKFDMALWGATQGFSGTSSGTPFDGTSHSMALCIDGQSQKWGAWTDEVYEPSFGSELWPFNPGKSFDTKSSNTLNIGSSYPASANNAAGIAVKTRALVILRLPSAAAMPPPATLTAVFEQLRANAGKLIVASAF